MFTLIVVGTCLGVVLSLYAFVWSMAPRASAELTQPYPQGRRAGHIARSAAFTTKLF